MLVAGTTYHGWLTEGDSIAGGVVFTINNPDGTTSTIDTSTAVPVAATVGDLITEINKLGIPGVTASFTTSGATGDASVGATEATDDTGILLTNTNANVAISAGATALADAGQGAGTPNYATTSTAATETIEYVTANGGDTSADLSNTNLLTQGNAQNAESVLNDAISYVAAQDGYIGAQINTLNAISQVMSTQQENIVSAQNAVQATDYASATSNMSKFEILSQTGIAALAQANSVQQEVTKLLQ